MLRAFAIGLIVFGIGSPEISARAASGEREATLAEINGILRDLEDLSTELAITEEAIEVGVASAVADWRYRECRFQGLRHARWTPHEERLTGLCLERRWSVPGGFAKASSVISCESGWDRRKRNGPYVGLSQIGSWPARFRTFKVNGWGLKPAWQNSRSMLAVTIRWAHAAGWSAWSCA
jgi:hypothetical protein